MEETANSTNGNEDLCFCRVTVRFVFYHRSSQNSNANSVHKAVTAHTANPSHAKLVSKHQYSSAAHTNGLTNRYHKPNDHFHNHTKFGHNRGPNKYVFINNDKEKQSKPAVIQPSQHKSNDIRHTSKKFTGSRNDVFRFTAVPKPVSTTCNLATKSSTTVQEPCKKTTPETVATTAASNIHQHKLKYVYTTLNVL